MARILLTLTALCLFSFAGLPMSSAWERVAGTDAAPAEDILAIAFADAAGRPQTTPYFDMAGAHPGMAPQATQVTITNTGTLDAAYDVSLAITDESPGPAVADVLHATVIREDDHEVYAGSLRNLTVRDAPVLPAGQRVSYVISVAWPDGGPTDNAYQGEWFTFDLQARARESR